MRAGGKRKRGEPHEPQPPAHEDPTVGAPIHADGQELGQRGEERVAEADREVAAAAGPLAQVGGASSSGENRPVEPRERAGRGPDQEQRVRRVFRDQGDNPERPGDWTNFDIGRVVRLFRTDQPGAIRLSLRKLHVRWWHASTSVMTKFLDRVGVPQRVLDLIPETVQTCQVCRTWAKPGPDHSCSVEIPDKFNEQVECGLLFVEKHIMFHMLDRCTRWHAARLIPDKAEGTLMKAIDELWVSIHGSPKELITDGESGIVASDATNQYLHRKGIKLHQRAKDQHARYIERRGALLRDAIHRAQSQLQEEGLAGVPFETILAEAVFCGNAMVTVGDSTPYNAVYGRVPRILPSIDQVAAPDEGRQPEPGTIQHTHRLREISIQAMIEGSARARLGRAMNTRTTLPAQRLNL